MLLIRVLQSVIVLSLLGIILLIFQSGAVSARQGVFVQDYQPSDAPQALSFAQPEVARNFYNELKEGGPPIIYSFSADSNGLFRAKIYLPRLAELENYRPGLALFGPGLPAPVNRDLNGLPFTVPQGMGLVISENRTGATTKPAPLPEFAEPFTQANYWEGQEIVREMPQSGTYYLAVFSRSGQAGKYVLEVGNKAEVGLKEILGFPLLWTKIHLWFGDWLTPLLVWLVLIGLLVFGLYRLGRAGASSPIVTVQPQPIPLGSISPAPSPAQPKSFGQNTLSPNSRPPNATPSNRFSPKLPPNPPRTQAPAQPNPAVPPKPPAEVTKPPKVDKIDFTGPTRPPGDDY